MEHPKYFMAMPLSKEALFFCRQSSRKGLFFSGHHVLIAYSPAVQETPAEWRRPLFPERFRP